VYQQVVLVGWFRGWTAGLTLYIVIVLHLSASKLVETREFDVVKARVLRCFLFRLALVIGVGEWDSK
jgi:hypothetical protein